MNEYLDWPLGSTDWSDDERRAYARDEAGRAREDADRLAARMAELEQELDDAEFDSEKYRRLARVRMETVAPDLHRAQQRADAWESYVQLLVEG